MFRRFLVKFYIWGFYSLVLAVVCCLAWFGSRPQRRVVWRETGMGAAETGGPGSRARPDLGPRGDDAELQPDETLPDIAELRRLLEPLLSTQGSYDDFRVVAPHPGRQSKEHFARALTRLLNVSVRRSPDRLVRVSWINNSWVRPVRSGSLGVSLSDSAADDICRMIHSLSDARVGFDRIRFIGYFGGGADFDAIPSKHNIDVVFTRSVLAKARWVCSKELFELADSISADPAFVTEYR